MFTLGRNVKADLPSLPGALLEAAKRLTDAVIKQGLEDLICDGDPEAIVRCLDELNAIKARANGGKATDENEVKA